MAVYIIDVFNVFLKPSPIDNRDLHYKLVYDVLVACFQSLSEMFFPLNPYKIWLNIPKCPQCYQ